MPDPSTPKRILFVNRYFYPDHSATSQILTDLATHLADNRFAVHVLCSRHRYDDPRASLSRFEDHRGVAIHRVWSTTFGRTSLTGRAIDYLSFYLSALVCALRLLTRGDVVVVKTDPPMISAPIALAARLKGAAHVNWLQDVFPEVAIELGAGAFSGPLGKIARRARDRSLQSATLNVAIGEAMADRLRTVDIPVDRIAVIPNWTDDAAVQPLPAQENPLRAEWSLTGKFVVGYSGNLGRAHDFKTALGAMRRLQGDPSIVFLIIGGGHGYKRLKTACANEGLRNVVFKPYQPRDALRLSLTLPDLHWVSLKPELEGLIVPSKVYGIAAAGRPILFVGSESGEVGRLIRLHDCGVVVDQGDAAGCAAAVKMFAATPDMTEKLGANARRMIDAYYNRSTALGNWTQKLAAISQDARTPASNKKAGGPISRVNDAVSQ